MRVFFQENVRMGARLHPKVHEGAPDAEKTREETLLDRQPPVRVSSESSIRVSELSPALAVGYRQALLLVGISRCAVRVAISGATCSVIQASRLGRFARLVRAGTSQRNVPTG
jgi:hypothetical protein